MSNRLKLILLLLGLATSVAIFLFYGLPQNWGYGLYYRILTVAAIIVTGSAVAISTLVFYSISNNRIITPSILGLDDLYIFAHVLVIFILGSQVYFKISVIEQFLFSFLLLSGYILWLYRIFFKQYKVNNFILLLVGFVCGFLFRSLAEFLMVLINPSEFLISQQISFANFNHVDLTVLIISAIGVLLLGIYAYSQSSYLNVMSLGRDQAINLGIAYDKLTRRYLILIAVLVALATALSGPMFFLGVMILNLTLEIFKTYKYQLLLPGSVLISIVILLIGQFVVSHYFNYKTEVSVIINFLGGIYFMFIILKKERHSWR